MPEKVAVTWDRKVVVAVPLAKESGHVLMQKAEALVRKAIVPQFEVKVTVPLRVVRVPHEVKAIDRVEKGIAYVPKGTARAPEQMLNAAAKAAATVAPMVPPLELAHASIPTSSGRSWIRTATAASRRRTLPSG